MAPPFTATLPSGVAVAPRAFGADAETLAPEDVVEYVSDEAYKPTVPVEPLMMAPPRVTPSALAQVIDPEPTDTPPRSRRFLSFFSDHWAFAAAFVLAGGLALRLTFPAGARPAPPPIATRATCEDTTMTVAPLPSPTLPLEVAPSAFQPPIVPAPARAPRARASVKRPPAASATASESPSASPPPAPAVTLKNEPSKATRSAKSTLDVALAELAAY